MQQSYLLLISCLILGLVHAFGNPPWSYDACVKHVRDSFLDLPGIDSAHSCWSNLKDGVKEACKSSNKCGNVLQNKNINHGKTCEHIFKNCLPIVKNVAGNKCRNKITVDVLYEINNT